MDQFHLNMTKDKELSTLPISHPMEITKVVYHCMDVWK